MFCNKCGNQLLEGAQFCNKCGAATASAAEVPQQPEQQAYPPQPYPPQQYPPQQVPPQPYPQQYQQQPYYQAPPPEPDVPNTGMNVLSFFIPIVGFIMYATSHQQTPIKAKAMLKMAIIGMCVSVGLVILVSVLAALIPMLMYL